MLETDRNLLLILAKMNLDLINSTIINIVQDKILTHNMTLESMLIKLMIKSGKCKQNFLKEFKFIMKF